MNCESCTYFAYDDEDESWYCDVSMDQDDFERIIKGGNKECPFYRYGDEYAIVRHQI